MKKEFKIDWVKAITWWGILVGCIGFWYVVFTSIF